MRFLDELTKGSLVLINPKMAKEETKKIEKFLLDTHIDNHAWLSTSGTTSNKASKWVALSKDAFVHSANAVNTHLNVKTSDTWIHVLPEFHVGGLSIWVRAELADVNVVDYKRKNNFKWNPTSFYQLCVDTKATLSALVPTQIYDLISLGLKTPPFLRAIIVGGGSLSYHLYKQARDLGWNILPSYGMTECCSQIATASLSSLNSMQYPSLEILPHIDQVKKDDLNRGMIASKSLLTCYGMIYPDKLKLVDPIVNNFFTCEDLIEITEKAIKPLGRLTDIVKIGGENVNISHLNHLLQEICLQLQVNKGVVIFASPDKRLGSIIHLVHEKLPKNHLNEIIERFNNRTFPFENIKKTSFVEKIPYTELKKVHTKKLTEMLG